MHYHRHIETLMIYGIEGDSARFPRNDSRDLIIDSPLFKLSDLIHAKSLDGR